MVTPGIPSINDPALRAAVDALARSAHVYRSVLFKIVADRLGRLSEQERHTDPLMGTLMEHEDLLTVSDSVINAWREELGSADRE